MSRFEQFTYRNHLGETLEVGKNGLYVDINDLRDYAWDVESRGNRISRFSRGITTKTLPIGVGFKDRDYVTQIKNKLFEFAEKDIIARKHGQIIIGDYYFNCYVTASSKTAYASDPCFTQFNIELTTDDPFWVREHKFELRKVENDADPNLEYPYDFPYDYYGGSGGEQIVNTHFAPCDFRMTIYGAVVNPSIQINGHTYKVNATVAAGEYLTIDSIAKTIVLNRNNGAKVNEFDNRERSSYIFEPISSGTNDVVWGDFPFDIVLLEKRSEPKWT